MKRLDVDYEQGYFYESEDGDFVYYEDILDIFSKYCFPILHDGDYADGYLSAFDDLKNAILGPYKSNYAVKGVINEIIVEKN